MFKRSLPFIAALLLSACIDTTGISPETQTSVHPQSNANATVTVTEYGDLQCPACQAAHTMIVDPLLADYGSKLRFEFHHFPLSSIHTFAMEAAEAAECAADQGKFWEFIDLAYENQESLSKASIKQWGETLKLDMDLYGRCRDSHIKRDAILERYNQGKNLGVRGTPTFFVNGKQVEATIDAIKKAVDDAASTQMQLL